MSNPLPLRIHFVLNRSRIWYKVDPLPSGRIEYLIVSAHVLKPAPERYRYPIGAESECGPRAVECGVADPQDEHVPLKLGGLQGLVVDLNGLEDLVEEVLGVREVRGVLGFQNARVQLLVVNSHVRLLEAHAQEDALVALLSELV